MTPITRRSVTANQPANDLGSRGLPIACAALLLSGCMPPAPAVPSEAAPPSGELTIAHGGAARFAIVVAKEATPAERHAAAELGAYLEKATGAPFPVGNGSNGQTPRLLVGPDAARLADPSFATNGIGPDGIVIRAEGNDLILAGGRPRGTLYAVYTFLEDAVGCRWWAPGATNIPHRTTLRVTRMNIRYNPPIEYRVAYWYPCFDEDWAARNKTHGGIHPPMAEARGGSFLHSCFCHTFNILIPPEKYFQAHPEWFSLIDGKRVPNKQLCLSNKELLREVQRIVRTQLKERPNIDYFWVSQNDWDGPCQCEGCAAVDREEGSPAGSILRFVNAVADELEKDYPHVRVATLAYEYSQKPPAKTKPRANVAVWLCAISANQTEALDHSSNGHFSPDLLAWEKIAPHLYVWEYTTDFWDMTLPQPNWFTLGANANLYARHHVTGVFAQGPGEGRTPDMAELRAWVLAKLMWNPTLDGNKLVREFLDGYYAAAGPHLYRYLATLSDEARAKRFFASYKYTFDTWSYGPLDQVSPRLMSFQALNEAWSHLKRAEAAVAGEPAFLARVRYAQLPLMHVFIGRWQELRDAATRAGAAWPLPDTVEALKEQFSKNTLVKE